MDDLVGLSCKGMCSRDTPALSETEITKYGQQLPYWHYDPQRKAIFRRFTAKNFMSAIKFFDDVAVVAEAEGHHPDLHLTNFREVEVVFSTHAISAVSLADVIMASKVDRVPVEYSKQWLQQQQQNRESSRGDVKVAESRLSL
eukprot:jgi/Mesvir1/25566/Mv01800-RA.1